MIFQAMHLLRLSVSTATLLLLLGLLLVGFTAFLFQIRRWRERQLHSVRADFDRELKATQLEIREATLQDVSREIHDHITLSLTLAKLHLNSIDPTQPDRLMKKTEEANQLITDAIERLREISHSLNSDRVASQGLLAAIENEIDRIEKTAQFSVKLLLSGEPIFLPNDTEFILFRVIQECFNNIIRHSRTRYAQLSLTYLADSLHIVVMDFGIGFSIPPSESASLHGGFGISSIQSRIQQLNGTVKIETARNEGTTLTFTIPYQLENSTS